MKMARGRRVGTDASFASWRRHEPIETVPRVGVVTAVEGTRVSRVRHAPRAAGIIA